MPPPTATTPQPHMGRNIERIRTIKGIKQDTLAKQVGMSRSTLSRLEQSPVVEEDILEQIAAALEMSVEAIKEFSEERVINNIQNNYEGSTVGANSSSGNSNCTYQFNPVEKLVEVMEK